MMRANQCTLDQHDKRVRKNWLICSAAALAMELFLMAKLMLTYSITEIPRKEFVDVVCNLVWTFFNFLLTYYCAYRKIGSRLLACELIISSFAVMIGWLFSFREFETLFSCVLLAIKLSLFVWWYIATIALYKSNKKLQAQQPYSRETHWMRANQYQLDQHDKKVRKNWLLSCAFQIPVLLLFGICTFFVSQNEPGIIKTAYEQTLFGLTAAFFYFLLFYNCAYKNIGIKLLKWQLLLSPFFIVINIISCLTQQMNPILFDVFLIGLATFAWMYYADFALYKSNRKLYTQHLRSTEAYTAALSVLQSAETKDQLHGIFNHLNTCNLDTKLAILEAYKDAKKQITEKSIVEKGITEQGTVEALLAT